jgi:hypothetical protein
MHTFTECGLPGNLRFRFENVLEAESPGLSTHSDAEVRPLVSRTRLPIESMRILGLL